ncbi:MAG: hypothetical protein R3C05_30800 [Pirellulaceae bacterium]
MRKPGAFASDRYRELMFPTTHVKLASDWVRARHASRALAEQLTYPGEIKVTVVRESRFTELAR